MIIDKNFSPLMERVFFGKMFSVEEVQALVHSMIDGTLSDLRIASVLTAFQFLSISPEIILSILKILHKSPFKENFQQKFSHLVDCGGVGAHRAHIVDVSTLSAFVAVQAGAHVAKFMTPGSSDQMRQTEMIWVPEKYIAKDSKQALRLLTKDFLVFLHGTSFYPLLKELSDIRKTLGFRTIIDLIFPLANPLPLHGQIIGVYHKDMMPIVIKCLKALGRKRALVVCAESGLDAISVCSPTYIVQLDNGKITHHIFNPRDFGITQKHEYRDLEISRLSPEIGQKWDAAKFKKHPAIFDATVAHAAAILWCGGLCSDLFEGSKKIRKIMTENKFSIG